MTYVKVFVLMAGLTALFLVVGDLLGGQGGMWLALALAATLNLVCYFASAGIALRAYSAKVVGPGEAPELYAIIERLSARAGLPVPQVAVSPEAQPNAFATGRNPSHSVVCVTQGALAMLDREQLKGVLSHELAHVRSHDTLLQTFTATLAGAISYLANLGFVLGGTRRNRRDPYSGLLTLVLAPLAAMLIQLAIGRQREYHADAVGAQISGRALALASALRRLDSAAHQIPMPIAPAMAPLAQVDPLAAYDSAVARLFSTHPPTEERIARLEALARELEAR